jgi:uncharacterized repeat protein (TIGR03803 family)
MLGGCAGSTPLNPSSFDSASSFDKLRLTSKSTYAVLYSFGVTATDGENPASSLLNVGGTFYGTTVAGGSGCYASGGCGTVFSVTTSGTETVLHNFTGGEDGALPYAPLIDVGGMLYGTTAGGASTGGTVFSMTPAGSETPLYHFQSSPDGFDPHASLHDVDGTLYGTTFLGGTKDGGTAFKIATSGGESVIHSFQGTRERHDDGKYPAVSLLSIAGTLYGTTYGGGLKNRGTVFQITLPHHEALLHNFKGGESDGAYPRGGLIAVNGALYGTASGGGNGGCKGCGNHEHYGLVFRITKSGKFHPIYKFKGYPNDGAVPDGDLVYVHGTFYGTTESGGANCSITHGCGTIFSLTPTGAEAVLHSFSAEKDGSRPIAGLINLRGTLYGTTSYGGTYNAGTVFAITP